MQQTFGSCCCLVTTLLWVAFGVESYRVWKAGRVLPTIGTLPTPIQSSEMVELTDADVETMPPVEIVSKLPVAHRLGQSSDMTDDDGQGPPLTSLVSDDEVLGYLGPPVRVLLPGSFKEWMFDALEAEDRQAAGEPAPHPDPIPELHLPVKPLSP